MKAISILALTAMATGVLAVSGPTQHIVKPVADQSMPADSGAPQVRLWLAGANGPPRVEVDLEDNDAQAVLLVSDRDLMYAQSGIVPPFLATTAIVPMERLNPRTASVKVNFGLLPPGASAYLQVVARTGDQVRASAIARYDAGGVSQPSSYQGPPFQMAMYAVTRVPPMLSSFGVMLDVTVPSNDWQLRHHLTVRHSGGTDVYVTLVEPGPGRGLVDIVETHQLSVDIGAANPGAMRILVARTDQRWPDASALVFAILEL